jgi:heptosyltransferase I
MTEPVPKEDEIRSILVIRLSAIGDVIMASALIPVLHRAYPQARITWLTEAPNAGLLQSNPSLDKLIIWPKDRWTRLIRDGRYGECLGAARPLLRELRDRRYDLVLDLQGLLKSGIWAWLSRGRRRIGLGSREGSQFLVHRVIDRHTVDKRIGAEYLKLAGELGLEAGDFPMDISTSRETQAEAERRLEAADLGERFAVIAPFTTRPQKHWLDQRWALLSAQFNERLGLPVLMLGGPGDRERAGAIAGGYPPIRNWVGETSLELCAAIIAKASLVVGVDTGLTHLGIAMETPTLALFGSTRPYFDTGFPFGKVLYEPLPCSPCKRRPSCDGEFTCMGLHTVEKVFDESVNLLDSAP